MTYTFKIDLNDGNGLKDFGYHNITYPFVGFSDKTNLNEELDNGFFEVISSLEEIPMWSYIEYTIDNEKRFFYVGNDESERLTKDEEKYLHRLELIETTKKLEKYPLETICFTQSQSKDNINYTLWDVLQRIFRIYEIQEDEFTLWDLTNYDELPNVNNNKILENIDEEIKDYLKSIEAPTLVMNNLTLREAFDVCLKYVNAICTMKDRYTLTCEFFNKINDLIDYTNKKEGFITSSSVDDYSTELQSFLENQITEGSDELYSIVYPSESGYDKLKTRESNYSVNETNFGVLLNNPIYNLQDLQTEISFRIGNLTSYNYSQDNKILSLADYIVEEDVYNKLPYKTVQYNNFTELTKINTIHYRFKDNFIDLNDYYKGFLFNQSTTLKAMMLQLAKEIAISWDYYSQYFEDSSNMIIMGYHDSGGFFQNLAYGHLIIPNDTSDYKNFLFEFSYTGVLPFQTLKFRTYYQTIVPTRLSINKNDISDTKIKTSSLMNQNNRIISLQNVSNNMKSTIERIGNYEYSITIRHNNITEVFNKGDFLKDNKDIYVCVIRETIYYNDFILCKYLFTKNYSRLNEFIGINSQIRQWQIPSGNETYERFIKKDSYCFISLDRATSEISNKNPGYTFSKTRESIFDFVRGGGYGKTINNVFFNSEDDVSVNNGSSSDVEQYWDSLVSGSNTLALECISEGTKDALIFNFGFNDNMSAGYMLEKDDSGIKTLMLKVPYANPNEGNRLGFLRNCAFTLTTSNIDFSTEDLPLTYVDWDNAYSNNQIMFDIPDQLILKDPAEILKFCFQLNFINKSTNDFIIGEGFGKYNPLVYNGTKKIYLYTSTNEIDRNNVFKAQGIRLRQLENSDLIIYDSNVENAIYSKIDLSDTLWSSIENISNVKWISLGTEDGDLLFAIKYNGDKRSIFLQFSNKREDLVEKY